MQTLSVSHLVVKAQDLPFGYLLRSHHNLHGPLKIHDQNYDWPWFAYKLLNNQREHIRNYWSIPLSDGKDIDISSSLNFPWKILCFVCHLSLNFRVFCGFKALGSEFLGPLGPSMMTDGQSRGLHPGNIVWTSNCRGSIIIWGFLKMVGPQNLRFEY